MIKEKPYIFLFFVGILVYVFSFLIFKKDNYSINIHDTYYIFKRTHLLNFSASYLLIFGILYFIFEKFNFKLNIYLTYGHILVTIILLILILFYLYKTDIQQNNSVNIFQLVKETDYNILLIKAILIKLIFHILLVINILYSICQNYKS